MSTAAWLVFAFTCLICALGGAALVRALLGAIAGHPGDRHGRRQHTGPESSPRRDSVRPCSPHDTPLPDRTRDGFFADHTPDDALADQRRDEALPYRTRDDFLSPAEVSLYRVLLVALGDRATVCPKVNLADVFFVARGTGRLSQRNRISTRHVDFLLCNPQTLRPVAGVELDDSSHPRHDRKNRDLFVDRVFQDAKLPLLRIPLRQSYSVSQLSARLVEHLGITAPVQSMTARESEIAAPAVSAGIAEPLCIKCGVPMVRRTPTRGRHVGQPFLGCPNYPRCRETLPLQ